MFFFLAFLNALSAISLYLTHYPNEGLMTLGAINVVLALAMLIMGVIEYMTERR